MPEAEKERYNNDALQSQVPAPPIDSSPPDLKISDYHRSRQPQWTVRSRTPLQAGTAQYPLDGSYIEECTRNLGQANKEFTDLVGGLVTGADVNIMNCSEQNCQDIYGVGHCVTELTADGVKTFKKCQRSLWALSKLTQTHDDGCPDLPLIFFKVPVAASSSADAPQLVKLAFFTFSLFRPVNHVLWDAFPASGLAPEAGDIVTIPMRLSALHAAPEMAQWMFLGDNSWDLQM